MSQNAEEPSIAAFCLRILQSGDLESKLAPAAPDTDLTPGPAVQVDWPMRDPELQMAEGAPRLPAPRELTSKEARRLCLARFAHHELQAVELFAWALLRWPELPTDLRRGFLSALGDEQRHCRMYLERLSAHGAHFGEHPHSPYFWKQASAISASTHGPCAFLSAIGLTLEQANLDFSLLYRDAFREAGDEATAQVCQRVHDDEIRHVRLAVEWLPKLLAEAQTPADASTAKAEGLAVDSGPASPGTATLHTPGIGTPSQLEAYRQTVPFPLSAARAKSRRFDASSRRKAGLSDEFIEYVRDARSTQETRKLPASSASPKAPAAAPGSGRLYTGARPGVEGDDT